MLGNSRVHPVLLSTDLTQARDFYHDKLGLEIVVENQVLIEFRCGDGTKVVVTKSTTGTADSQTQIRWEVEDLRGELDELQSRGVRIEEYDLPGVKTETVSRTWASPGLGGSSIRARTCSRLPN